VNDLAAIDIALKDDPEFKELFRATEVRFRHEVANFTRVRRLLPFRITRKIHKQLEAGERDVDKITEQVCGSLTTLFITVAIQVLVRFMVEWILKRWSK
jgi:hypothetical protein